MNVNAQKSEKTRLQQRIGGKSPRHGVLFVVTAAYKNPGHDHKVIKT